VSSKPSQQVQQHHHHHAASSSSSSSKRQRSVEENYIHNPSLPRPQTTWEIQEQWLENELNLQQRQHAEEKESYRQHHEAFLENQEQRHENELNLQQRQHAEEKESY
jgi:hypothetical protein